MGTGISSAWKEDAKDEAKSGRSNSESSAGRGGGEPRHVVVRVGPPYTERGTSQDAEVELAERRSQGIDARGGNPGGIDGAGGEANGAIGDGDGSAAPAPVYKVYKRRWFGLVQLTLLNIIVSWDWLTYSPVASDAASFFNTSETVINWLSTAFLFAFVFITPVVIYVLHFGPRPSIIVSALLIFLGNWIRYAGTRSNLSADGSSGGRFGVVMFGQILTGLAQPFVLAAPARYSDLWFTNRGRVAATALMSLANPFGAALGQLIVPFWVYKPADIPNMVLYVSIISTVCSVPSFFVYAKPPTPAAPSGETPKAGLLESVRRLAVSVEFWLLFIPFTVYVGFFNSISSLLNQILLPYGYSDNDAGIGGALLIVVGLVSAAVTSPILDRTKRFVLCCKLCVPVIGGSYLAFLFMPQTRDSAGLAGPYVVLSILGAASFTLVPVAVELLVEVTHPVSPEVTSTLAWSGGQLLGGLFIIISDALRAGDASLPPQNMQRALVFTAAVAMAVVPVPLCLGLFGRSKEVQLRRVRSDEQAGAATTAPDIDRVGGTA